MTELLLGCGFSRAKLLGLPGKKLEWQDLITLDNNSACAPDIICDLDQTRWLPYAVTKSGTRAIVYPMGVFIRDFFDEVHAYEVLEHLGSQGDAPAFFDTFWNIHRMLKPGGHLFATCPSRYSPWLWGDPSHRRVIYQESLSFLSQKIIEQNRKAGTQMSDFRELWNLDFEIVASTDNHSYHQFCLRANK
jgi:hypothetical protein